MNISASIFLKKYEKTCGKVYTKTMKNMLKYIFPSEFHSHPAYVRAFILGMLYLGTALAQLFSFEKFPAVVAGYALPGGNGVATMISMGIILCEVAALPYLISMKLSTRWSNASKWAALGTPALWLVLSLWLNIAPQVDRLNTGLFGASIPTVAGIWLVAFAALWLWAAVLVTRELPARGHILRNR